MMSKTRLSSRATGFIAGFAALATGAFAQSPDVSFCQLYGLDQYGREGDVVGLSLATTSWNIGDADLIWEASPDPDHPMIVMNLYREMDGRFTQIGQSWIKHGFFALANTQCGGTCTFEPGHSSGDWLGMGCTDTYTAFLNADQDGLGPRYEVNPWTGGWKYQGSVFQDDPPIQDQVERRLQVHDADLDPDQNPGANYYAEGYYVHKDDSDVINSTAWKPVTPVGDPGGNWNFQMSSSGTFPNIGFAYDAWSDADMVTTVAQEVPVVEFESPDGRSVVSVNVEELDNGMYRYTYFVYNIDMHRQVGSFSVPLPAGAPAVQNPYFHAVEHHGESFNLPNDNPDRVEINNDPWGMEQTSDAVTWSTDTNPIRWGTGYTFGFDTIVPPTEGDIEIGHFTPGDPGSVTGTTMVPTPDPLPLIVQIDGEVPVEQPPHTCFSLGVNVTEQEESFAAGSVRYRNANEGGAFQSVPLTQVKGELYAAGVPGFACNGPVELYVEVEGSGGSVVTLPPDAPGEVYTVAIGETQLAAEDDMEEDTGWVVGAPDDDATTGIWNRMDPDETTAFGGEVVQPGDDHTPDGTDCWVTDGNGGASAGSNDVDDGKTTVVSQPFNLEGLSEATLSYWRWFHNGSSDEEVDTLEVSISDDGGTTWTVVETVGGGSAEANGGWFLFSFDVQDFVSLTSDVRLRFVATDEGSASIVEAAIDDLAITSFVCEGLGECDADITGDGSITSEDLNVVLGAFGKNANGDVNCDNATDSTDLNMILGSFGTDCP